MTSSDRAIDTKNYKRARLLVLLVAVFWSTSGLFAKAPWLLAWPVDVRGPLLAFWRTLFAGLFLLPLVRQPRWSWRLIPTTLIFATMNVTYMTAMAKTTAANAIWLQNTAPLWIVLFSLLFLKEKITRRDYLMLGLCLCGIATILSGEAAHSQEIARQGVVWGVLGGITFAAVVISVRWVRDLEACWVIALNHLVTAVLLFPFLIQQGIYPTAGQSIWLAAFGILQLGIPYVAFARALKRIPSHEASFIVLLEPILVPLWVFLAWRSHASYQAPQWWTLVGAALILAGLVVRYWPARSSTPE